MISNAETPTVQEMVTEDALSASSVAASAAVAAAYTAPSPAPSTR